MIRICKYNRIYSVISIAVLAAGVLVAGCSNNQSPAKQKVVPLPPPTATSGTVAAGIPAAPASPHGNMDMGSSASLTPTPDLDAKIAKATKSNASPKNLSALYAQRGDERMMDTKASPHIKYSAALSDYSKAVKLDPTNKAAANNKQLIESIYRGMGRPIPPE